MKPSKLRGVLACIIVLNVCLVGALAFVVLKNVFHTDVRDVVVDAFKPDAVSVAAPPKTAVAAAAQSPISPTIADGVTVNDMRVGGMTADEARRALAAHFRDSGDEMLYVFADKRIDIPMRDFNARWDIDGAVASALTARAGDALKLGVLFDAQAVADRAAAIAADAYAAPVEPTMTKDEDGFHITDGKPGRVADAGGLAARIGEGLQDGYQNGGAKVPVITEDVPNAIGAEKWEASQDLIGTYTTKFSAGQSNRNQNIITAAATIHNRAVLPGEVFSTLAAFGPTTYENGYRMAGTYERGKVVDGMGGGMCQVSTTLYVALLYSELDVVERRNHSMRVAYVDYAFDATLAGDTIDMKFKNDTDYPVLIESVLTNNSITVNIYGHETRKPGRELKFEKAFVTSQEPPEPLVTQDPTLPLDERVEDVAAKTGYTYRLFKYAYEDGKLTETTQVNTSVYRAVRGETRVGTGPAATPTPPPAAQPAPAAPPVQTAEPDPVEPPAQDAPNGFPELIVPMI